MKTPVMQLGMQLAVFCLALLAWPALAEKDTPQQREKNFNQAVDTAADTSKAAAKSQKKINKTQTLTDKRWNEFRGITLQTEKLRVYVEQLKKLIADQEQKKASLNAQIQQIEETEQNIVPLLLEMTATLEKFVGYDLPFKADERVNRLEKVRATLDASDKTVAEKYREVMDAYKAELDYGRTIGTYRGLLKDKALPRIVDYLHLGRVALYYQTLDADESGFWDTKKQKWQTLPLSYAGEIRRGIRMAKEQAAPNLLELPLPAPKLVSSPATNQGEQP